MFDVYPYRVIITNNGELARHYNAEPESALMASYCLTTEDAFFLIKENRQIETIILINGEGEELICFLADQLKQKKENMPNVLRLGVSDCFTVASKEIRNAFCRSLYFFLSTG